MSGRVVVAKYSIYRQLFPHDISKHVGSVKKKFHINQLYILYSANAFPIGKKRERRKKNRHFPFPIYIVFLAVVKNCENGVSEFSSFFFFPQHHSSSHLKIGKT